MRPKMRRTLLPYELMIVSKITLFKSFENDRSETDRYLQRVLNLLSEEFLLNLRMQSIFKNSSSNFI